MTDSERVFLYDAPRAGDRLMLMWDMDTSTSSPQQIANGGTLPCTCLHKGDSCV
jgi:hypothetical protein